MAKSENVRNVHRYIVKSENARNVHRYMGRYIVKNENVRNDNKKNGCAFIFILFFSCCDNFLAIDDFTVIEI